MKIGVFLYETEGPEVIALTQRAEALGFESLWAPDRILVAAGRDRGDPLAGIERLHHDLIQAA